MTRACRMTPRLRRPPSPAGYCGRPAMTAALESNIEARFAVSNGFLGVRASRAVSRGSAWISWQHTLNWSSWPRTFVAGLFDTPNADPPVPALVPAPDWLRLRVAIDGAPLLLRSGELVRHWRTLDLRRGLLVTEWHQRQADGRLVRLRTLRLVSLAQRALALQVMELFVDDVPADVTLDALLEVGGTGLELVSIQPELSIWRTGLTRKGLAMATSATVRLDDDELAPSAREQSAWTWRWRSQPRQPATLARMVAFARATGRTTMPACARARRWRARGRSAGGASSMPTSPRWAERWSASDIEIEGDERAQLALRFATYHLIGAANPEDERVSIGARALTGDSYLGHVFWDTEVYLLPFYTLTWPEAARALLMYRYRTLDGARAKAARMGYRGALYAWESADTGEEVTPEQIVDPAGRVIDVLCGKLEQHISADVAYAVWQYWQATGDDPFLRDAGAEIILETARFWASRSRLEADGSYHIRGVIGPDEYHEHIDDNAFTNVMARWNIAARPGSDRPARGALAAACAGSAAAARARARGSGALAGGRGRARDRVRSRERRSSSSSKATSIWKRSTSPRMRTAPPRWTWCSAASARNAPACSSRRTSWPCWRCSRTLSTARCTRRTSDTTSRVAGTAAR